MNLIDEVGMHSMCPLPQCICTPTGPRSAGGASRLPLAKLSEQTFWPLRAGPGPLATAGALSHLARYVPYLVTAGAHDVLVKR